jgi:putative hydrolase of the HAD superfamily
VRVRCRAVLVDAAGVLVLPDPGMVAAALAPVGIAVASEQLERSHYVAVRRLDRDDGAPGRPYAYFAALVRALGAREASVPAAVQALAELEDRDRSGQVLWSRPVARARETLDGLATAGVPVAVVTNSDGHAAENLREAGICQVGPGPGARVAAIIDSALVGAAKPDPAIFAVALEAVGVPAFAAVHVGDTIFADVAGARAAGVEAVHVDPHRLCRAADHRHVRSLGGLHRHVAAAGPGVR